MVSSGLRDDPHGRHRLEFDQVHWHSATSTVASERSVSPSSTYPVSGNVVGTWGERDVSLRPTSAALDGFDERQSELTALQLVRAEGNSESLPHVPNARSERSTQSHQSTRDRSSVAHRLTRALSGSPRERDRGRDLESAQEPIGAVESQTDDEKETHADPEEEEDFDLDQFIREGHLGKRAEGLSAKKLGVVWKDLTVKGTIATSTFVRTLPDAILGTFGPDLCNLIIRYIPSLSFNQNHQTRTLLSGFGGVLRGGEMMLVLGRPGSGCSTFLKTIANNRGSFAEVTGDVSYGGIPAAKQAKLYRGEVTYNEEDDVHFAALNVWQTLKFSLMNKTKKREEGEIPIIIDALLRMLGMSHTKYTPVGDTFIRGVSGGEKKRVSIAETLASKSTVVCWDNSTRGLDSSTALDYAKSLRIMADISNRTTFVTLYQAGEGIYSLMDKVMVIDQGRCIFQGPSEEAKQYFIDLGYHCPDRQTTPDFLTSVTDPIERWFREGFEAKAPKTPEDLERAFKASPMYQMVIQDVQDYEKELRDTDSADSKMFEKTTQEQKSETVPASSSYTVSFVRQVQACTLREFWLTWGNKPTLCTKLLTIIANTLIVGSLYHGQPLDTQGTFTRGGSLFFSIAFLGWLQMSELVKAVTGRAVVARHKDYAFYRPSAVSIARVVADFPMLLWQVTIFGAVMYFMTSLDVVASKFGIYMLFVYTTTLCITSLYRLFAALSPTIHDAVRFSGITLNVLVIFTGYVIPKTQLLNRHIWFGWMYWINPVAYSFEAVISNEFGDRDMACAEINLVPKGPGVLASHQGCAVSGASLNAHSISGADYIGTTYNYSRSNLWRNLGVVIAFTALYIIVTALATEFISFAATGGGALLFKKPTCSKKCLSEKSAKSVDEESIEAESSFRSSRSSSNTLVDLSTQLQTLEALARSSSVFTWRDINYTVPYRGGQRKLLNGVSGYAKPGKMVALMGASGAGKTTLLNILSQRQRVGIVTGDMFVDGRPIGPDFQRNTGFCEQMDLHDGTATVREALEFSALLRQDGHVPEQEKLDYVATVLDLLELGDIEDALVKSLGVEQRKRLTIGVELAAKPSVLLFLDEPTSGLDSNSAFSIVRFLKKLTQAGQAVICTIHQPSSILIQQFDMILALNPGGNVFYFGPVGDNGQDVIKYFADRGVDCPPNRNVAEFILETAIKGGRRRDGKKIDWNEEWRNSPDHAATLAEIDLIQSFRRTVINTTPNTNTCEFATSIWLQTTLLTKRVFTQYWRNPSYLYSKLFTSVIIGIFNGFTFYGLGNSIQDMQSRMFSTFIIVMMPATIVNGVVPKFHENMALWQTRELPSRVYGWVPFTTAMVVAEIPIAVVSSIIYWLLWYFPAGLPRDSGTAVYVFLMTILFFLFQASWGQWICAFAPSFTVISNILPFFFVMFGFFNGVVRPFASLPVFWRHWAYYVNPSTWWIGGVISATLSGTPIRCTANEMAKFTPPAGQTCLGYAGAYAEQAGGYVQELAGGVCGLCRFRSGNEYMATLNVQPGDKWRNLGVFVAFVVSNWALVYFFVWSVRIKGWSFGFGRVAKAVERLMGRRQWRVSRGNK